MLALHLHHFAEDFDGVLVIVIVEGVGALVVEVVFLFGARLGLGGFVLVFVL